MSIPTPQTRRVLAALAIVFIGANSAQCEASANQGRALAQKVGRSGASKPHGIAPSQLGNPIPAPDASAAKFGNEDNQQLTLKRLGAHWLHTILWDPIVLFTLVLAVSTIGLWLATRRLWQGAEKQVEDFKKSIAEAGRAANAMEGVAHAMDQNVKGVAISLRTSREMAATQREFGERQIRAYLSVLIGGATYQDLSNNLHFAVQPVLLNTGHTPARKVRYRATAAILSADEAAAYKFRLPIDRKGSTLLGPQQSATISLVVADVVADAEIEVVKRGVEKLLYGWGLVIYEDVFGKTHKVTFCQQLYWNPGHPAADGTPTEVVRGWYVAKHNRSN